MKSLLVLSVMMFVSSPLFAVDSVKCSKMLNDGLYKRYTYGGVGEAFWNVCTRNSKKEGSSTVTSDATTETSTMMVDTRYTSNVWTSQTQSTSSFGDCSMFAQAEQLKKDREVYIAQNEPEVLIDIARGGGEHLKVITFYSACKPDAYKELSSSLQKSISESETVPDFKSICNDIDQIISKNDFLKANCSASI